MKKLSLTLIALLMASVTFAQSEQANDVMKTLRLANDYFMAKYADPTLPTNVNRIRPSSLWTRAVYYEGLMALYEIDKAADRPMPTAICRAEVRRRLPRSSRT